METSPRNILLQFYAARIGREIHFRTELVAYTCALFQASPTSMGKIRLSLTAPVLALVGTLLPLQLHAQASAVAPAQARVIVKLRSDSALWPKVAAPGVALRPMHARALGERLGVTMNDGTPLSERAQVVVADGVTSSELA